MQSLPDPLVSSSPHRLGGTPVFAGTRVPLHTLFDFLEVGYPIDQFLEEFPGVTRAHVIAVLEQAKLALKAPAT